MDTKQAEKDYLRRSSGGDWESSKPFPPPGQAATDDHAQHLLDFAVLLRVLAPGPSDLVLDLGAGPCWVSDWLRKCGVRTVALDIAWDMLRLGASRLGGARGLVAGDMEQLPFADSVFSKACCLNAFHHVPDAKRALGEISRVLEPDGVVIFSEPGLGHATHPTSLAASRNYGVLENEILIDDFMELCLAAGFADVRLHPIAHIVPLFELQKDQWRDWRRFTASQRPVRAFDKLWRAALEIAGFGKKDVLFEEAFAIRLLRELQPVIEQHPVITAHRSPFVRPVPTVDNAILHLLSVGAAGGGAIAVRVRIVNAGTTHWDTASTALVRLGVQLLTADGELIDRDHSRHSLPHALSPGEQCEMNLEIPAPAAGGSYQLKFDLVREGVTWFELAGSQPLVHRIDITS